MSDSGSVEENPLLSRTFRIPFRDIEAQHVAPGIRERLQHSRADIDALARNPESPSWANTSRRLDAVTQDTGETLNPVHLLLSVAETPALRDAHNSVLPEVTRFWSGLPLNPELWARIKAFSGTEEGRSLQGIRARHLEKTLREFQRAGADLAPDRKARLESIQVELAQLQQKFGENVLDATAAFELHVTDESRLEGLPPGPLSRFRASADEKGLPGWLLTLDFPSFEPVMKYARKRGLREELHAAYVGRCRHDAFDNVALIPEILRLRQELAEILGYAHFPDLQLQEAMARTGGRAAEFERDLVERTRPYWKRDVALLRKHASDLGIGELQPWDVSFVAESLRKAQYKLDDETLRPYFPLEQVLAGLFELTRRVFGLSVERVDNPQVWHPDVRFYELRDEAGTWLGAFYTDWFPRKEKRQGAWMHDLLTGGPRSGGAFAPHLGFIAGNFSPPEEGRPALLTHREVRTVFHEFGHLLHHLTSVVPIPGRAGLNVAWDWVEVPSQFMENWTWEEEALRLFARHYETGQELPRDLLARMLSARRFQAGWYQMRQLSFGTLDLALHEEFALRRGEDLLAFTEKCLLPLSPSPSFARSHVLPTFTHLFSGGYAARYYSYLWSEALEADAFTRFRKEGILSREVGREYLETILSKGDSADPDELFRRFMGRDADPGALIARNLGRL